MKNQNRCEQFDKFYDLRKMVVAEDDKKNPQNMYFK